MFEKEAEEYYYKTYPVTLNIGEEERKKLERNCTSKGGKMTSLHLIVFNKLQGLDVKDFSGADDIIVTEHCKEYVNGCERRQDCFCLSFRSGNKLLYAHKVFGYRFERY